MKHETVCITRLGLNFKHTEGADFAAKVTYHAFELGKISPLDGVKSEWLVPRVRLLGRLTASAGAVRCGGPPDAAKRIATKQRS